MSQQEGKGKVIASEKSEKVSEKEKRVPWKTDFEEKPHVYSDIPRRRQEVLKNNGWGYQDSKFIVLRSPQPTIMFTGNRYKVCNKELPHFIKWVTDTLGVDITTSIKKVAQDNLVEKCPKPNITDDMLIRLFRELGELSIQFSLDDEDRLFRAHGHTLHEIHTLREGMFDRIPDIVIWPRCHDDVVEVVEVARRLKLAIIPFGGGTSVTCALQCPVKERRPIISLDTSQMNRILWISKENLSVCVESGIFGQDLERELSKKGYTVGHEPDSYEFSSVGGWVATRASGMKKNVYGNIEDLLIHAKFVTPAGVIEKGCQIPRMSAGPDVNQFILGSEGTLGVVTEVTLKIRPLPKCKRYQSLVFPDFDRGVLFMREVAYQRLKPSSVRLMDNEQFKFGHALKPREGMLSAVSDTFKKWYITGVKGFNLDSMCVATLLLEGSSDQVAALEKKLIEVAGMFGGIAGGAAHGKRGYTLTFVIAYIRDLALNYDIIAESFETSVPWDRVVTLCWNVKHRVKKECKSFGIDHFLITCRVTQTYDAGACIYFYFAFNSRGIKNHVHVYETIESRARDEVIASGGSISHHHGVGKIRRKWLPETISTTGMATLGAIKNQLDPQNIFASGNLLTTSKL